jgi:hypothetical protein
VREGRCHFTTLCHPLPYLLHVAPLKRGRRHLQKGYGHVLCTRRGRRRDKRPARRVFPVTSGPLRPSRSLCHHPKHCSVIPSAVGTQVATPAVVQPPVFRQPSPQTGVWTVNKQEAPVLLPSKPLMDGHKTRHDARQTQDSSGRLSTPRHCVPCRHMYHLEPCGMTVNRLPLAYKRRRLLTDKRRIHL